MRGTKPQRLIDPVVGAQLAPSPSTEVIAQFRVGLPEKILAKTSMRHSIPIWVRTVNRFCIMLNALRYSVFSFVSLCAIGTFAFPKVKSDGLASISHRPT
jgi:hypothetical protein